jgi:hypothetical protein
LALTKKIKLHFKFPKIDNDKKPISPATFDKINNDLVEKFGGLSIEPPSEGFWKHEGLIYRDQTLEYIIFIPDLILEKRVRPRLEGYLKQFRKVFRQIDIFCYYYNTTAT